MFGYVRPFKPNLRICEYDTYKAVYCGLCGRLGKSFGAAARVTLSYDFVFLSMLHYGVNGSPPAFATHRCYVNPLKKVPVCGSDEVLANAADLAFIMIYYKLLDNMRDGGALTRLGCRLLLLFVRRAYRKAARRRPVFDEVIGECMRRQAALEEERCESIDAACEPTAQAMAAICRALDDNPDRRRVLERLGYLIGRYVYLCDAVDDLEDDLRTGNYNPFICRHKLERAVEGERLAEVRDSVRETMYLTVAEAAKAYQLLGVELFAPILENIVTLGMRATVDSILLRSGKSPAKR